MKIKQLFIGLIALFGLGIGSANALTALGGVIHFAASHGVTAYATTHGEYTRPCETQDNVLATRNGGYNFEVTACEFKDNAGKLVLVK